MYIKYIQFCIRGIDKETCFKVDIFCPKHVHS